MTTFHQYASRQTPVTSGPKRQVLDGNKSLTGLLFLAVNLRARWVVTSHFAFLDMLPKMNSPNVFKNNAANLELSSQNAVEVTRVEDTPPLFLGCVARFSQF